MGSAYELTPFICLRICVWALPLGFSHELAGGAGLGWKPPDTSQGCMVGVLAGSLLATLMKRTVDGRQHAGQPIQVLGYVIPPGPCSG